jgi:hypothetical protein
LSESVAVDGELTGGIGTFVPLSELALFSESLAESFSYLLGLPDTVSVSELLGAARGITAVFSETSVLGELLMAIAARFAFVSETASGSELLSVFRNTLAFLTETSQSVVDQLAASRGVAFSLSALVPYSAGSIAETQGVVVGLNAHAGIVENLSTVFVGLQSLTDIVSFAENAFVSRGVSILLNTTVGATETLGTQLVASLVLIEFLPYATGLSASVGISASVADVLFLSDLSVAKFTAKTSLLELVPVAGSLATVFDGTQFLAEVIGSSSRLDTRFAVTVAFPVGIGWYVNVDGFGLRSSTTRKFDSGEVPLRTSGENLTSPIFKKPIRKLKDGV